MKKVIKKLLSFELFFKYFTSIYIKKKISLVLSQMPHLIWKM